MCSLCSRTFAEGMRRYRIEIETVGKPEGFVLCRMFACEACATRTAAELERQAASA